MLRIVLIGVGVVTAAVGGYIVKRKLSKAVPVAALADALAAIEPDQDLSLPRQRKQRRVPVAEVSQNGDGHGSV